MKHTSFLSMLKSTNAVLFVLGLALLAQVPHAADVFRLIVQSKTNFGVWQTVHSYSYAIALELAVLLFVVQNRKWESYGFAVVSMFVNLSYYSLHDIDLFRVGAFPPYLVSIALPVAIALYSHAVADSHSSESGKEEPERTAKRVTRTVRNTQTVEQSEQFIVPTVQPEIIKVVQLESEPVQLPDYSALSDEQKREQLAIIANSEIVPSKPKLATMFGISRTTVYSWLNEIKQAQSA